MDRFFRWLWSGIGGSDNNAIAAVGKTLAVFLGLIWIAWKLIKLIIIIIEVIKVSVPNFKNGPYNVQLTSAGPNPKALKKELCRINGYNSLLAKKVIKSAPCIMLRGVTQQDGEDFVTVFGATGATIDIVEGDK